MSKIWRSLSASTKKETKEKGHRGGEAHAEGHCECRYGAQAKVPHRLAAEFVHGHGARLEQEVSNNVGNLRWSGYRLASDYRVSGDDAARRSSSYIACTRDISERPDSCCSESCRLDVAVQHVNLREIPRQLPVIKTVADHESVRYSKTYIVELHFDLGRIRFM